MINDSRSSLAEAMAEMTARNLHSASRRVTNLKRNLYTLYLARFDDGNPT